MAVSEQKISNDQKKLILAVALGIVAIVALWWTFFGFGGSTKPKPRSVAVAPSASPSPASPRNQGTKADGDTGPLTLAELQPISDHWSLPAVPEARRNIFAYYVPPTPTPSPPPLPPTPSPTPIPPFLLAAISPSNVFAGTPADFSLDVTGDKFAPAAHIVVDGRELPTRYKSPQQLSATVTAAMIANPGQRQIVVKTSDGKLYSNTTTLSVIAPPPPNYTYVGTILTRRHIGDTAIMQDKASKEILNVQRGDILSGRFRVTSISERELVLVDTNLMIKHTLPLTNEGERRVFPQGRPTPRVASEDDEPY